MLKNGTILRMKTIHYLLLTLLIGVCTLGIIFSRNGVIDTRMDTQIYVGQINFYEGKLTEDTQSRLRSFKPFYGVIGASLSDVMTAEQAIATINIVFYFGLLICSFYFLRELGFKDKFAMIGSAWIGTGYPVLKYGLALLTDISGWFFALATITIFLMGLRKQNSYFLILASLVGFLGSLCKETGVLGLAFAGVYLVLLFIFTKKGVHIKNLVKVILPFLLLEAIFLYILFQKNGGTSFLDWFLFNKQTVPTEYHSFYYFFFTELSTFSLLWLYALYTGYVVVFTKKITATKHNYILGSSLLIATLPVLVWPMFLSRVLYIGYLSIIPCALAGLAVWSFYNHTKVKTFYILSVLPVVASVSLFILAGGGSLFDMLKKLF